MVQQLPCKQTFHSNSDSIHLLTICPSEVYTCILALILGKYAFSNSLWLKMIWDVFLICWGVLRKQYPSGTASKRNAGVHGYLSDTYPNRTGLAPCFYCRIKKTLRTCPELTVAPDARQRTHFCGTPLCGTPFRLVGFMPALQVCALVFLLGL